MNHALYCLYFRVKGNSCKLNSIRCWEFSAIFNVFSYSVMQLKKNKKTACTVAISPVNKCQGSRLNQHFIFFLFIKFNHSWYHVWYQHFTVLLFSVGKISTCVYIVLSFNAFLILQTNSTLISQYYFTYFWMSFFYTLHNCKLNYILT